MQTKGLECVTFITYQRVYSWQGFKALTHEGKNSTLHEETEDCSKPRVQPRPML